MRACRSGLIGLVVLVVKILVLYAGVIILVFALDDLMLHWFTWQQDFVLFSLLMIGGFVIFRSKGDFQPPHTRISISHLILITTLMVSSAFFLYSVQTLSFGFYWLIENETDYPSYLDNRLYLLSDVILFAVAAPIVEEIMYRRGMYRHLRSLGHYPAAFTVAILFGLSHENVLSAFVFSLVLSEVYRRTGSLIPVMIIHALNNSIALIGILMMELGWLSFLTDGTDLLLLKQPLIFWTLLSLQLLALPAVMIWLVPRNNKSVTTDISKPFIQSSM